MTETPNADPDSVQAAKWVTKDVVKEGGHAS